MEDPCETATWVAGCLWLFCTFFGFIFGVFSSSSYVTVIKTRLLFYFWSGRAVEWKRCFICFSCKWDHVCESTKKKDSGFGVCMCAGRVWTWNWANNRTKEWMSPRGQVINFSIGKHQVFDACFCLNKMSNITFSFMRNIILILFLFTLRFLWFQTTLFPNISTSVTVSDVMGWRKQLFLSFSWV